MQKGAGERYNISIADAIVLNQSSSQWLRRWGLVDVALRDLPRLLGLVSLAREESAVASLGLRWPLV
jgi:hypothetical protein